MINKIKMFLKKLKAEIKFLLNKDPYLSKKFQPFKIDENGRLYEDMYTVTVPRYEITHAKEAAQTKFYHLNDIMYKVLFEEISLENLFILNKNAALSDDYVIQFRRYYSPLYIVETSWLGEKPSPLCFQNLYDLDEQVEKEGIKDYNYDIKLNKQSFSDEIVEAVRGS